MSRGGKIVLAAVVVGAGALTYFRWSRPKRDVSKDLEPNYVQQLAVTIDGKPLPAVIRSGEAHPIVVRLQIPPDRSEDSYLALFMVVDSNGYEQEVKPDPIEAFQQSGARNAPGVSLSV